MAYAGTNGGAVSAEQIHYIETYKEYRVKSQRGVQFRIWATNVLKEYKAISLH